GNGCSNGIDFNLLPFIKRDIGSDFKNPLGISLLIKNWIVVTVEPHRLPVFTDSLKFILLKLALTQVSPKLMVLGLIGRARFKEHTVMFSQYFFFGITE